MDTRRKGTEGEDLAVKFLRKRGYKILCRNFFTRQGEIDIIGKDKGSIVFLEVKTRNSSKFGCPAESVTGIKAERIRKTALYYLVKNHLTETPYRFEVVSILKAGADRYAIDVIPLEFCCHGN